MPSQTTAVTTSIIVPTRNQWRLLESLVESLARTLGPHRAELLVIDNGSDEPATRNWLDGLPARLADAPFDAVRVIEDPSPFNYSALNNRAARRARGRFLCFLNDDVEALGTADWLGPMLAHASDPGVGCVGAKLLYPDDTVQHAGVMLGMGRVAGHPFKGVARDAPGPGGWLTAPRRVSAVTGACLVVRREVFEAVGGFDPGLAVAWNDVDLCLRADEAGYRCVWTPEAVLRHHESVSRRGSARRPDRATRRRHAHEVALMQARWGARLSSDPFLGHLPTAARRPPGSADRRSRWPLLRSIGLS